MKTAGQRTTQAPICVRLVVEQGLLDRLCLLGGAGFTVRARAGCSVRELLCGQLQIEPDYLAQRIQIIFLNGKAVDDVDTAIVPADASIGLSAAMPGLAGAMLRKGSRYAPMRIQLPARGWDSAATLTGDSDMVVKLFNMLQRELGPEFLRRGVRVPGRAFSNVLALRPGSVGTEIVTAEVDGGPVEPQVLLDTDWSGRQVLLTIQV